MDEALAIKNTDIVNELSLPPVKIHCSVLAEDAIKAAITDYKSKQEARKPVKPRLMSTTEQLALETPAKIEPMIDVTPKAIDKDPRRHS